MYNIAIIDHIAKSGLDMFIKEGYSCQKDINGADALLLRSSKIHDLNPNPNLLAVGRAGSGTDNIPVQRLSHLGIPVFFAPGANANAVKELVLSAMLMGLRHIHQAIEFVNTLNNNPASELNNIIEQGKKQFIGHELFEKTLGIIGLGHIGVRLANAAHALGMNIIAFDPAMRLEHALALMPSIHKTDDINEIFSNSDVISLHVPANEKTLGMINHEAFKRCKNHLLLLNFSRGSIVDEPSVLDFLNTNPTSCYICDFPTPALIATPRALCLPHLGASTSEAQDNASKMVIEQMINYLKTGQIRHAVNFPDIHLTHHSHQSCTRLIIFNHNHPGVIAKISDVLAKSGCNIERMINNSKDDMAVNVIDISDFKKSANLKDLLLNIDDVVNVRLIELK